MINKVILLGNVGRDPEVRHLDNNASVARFSLATSESYKNKNGERISNTEWHNIVAWRNNADFAGKYIKKGTLLYIEGKIRTRSWDDKEGNKRYTTEIEVESFQLIGRKNEEQGQAGSAIPQSNTTAAIGNELDNGFDYTANPESTDDLPF